MNAEGLEVSALSKQEVAAKDYIKRTDQDWKIDLKYVVPVWLERYVVAPPKSLAWYSHPLKPESWRLLLGRCRNRRCRPKGALINNKFWSGLKAPLAGIPWFSVSNVSICTPDRLVLEWRFKANKRLTDNIHSYRTCAEQGVCNGDAHRWQPCFVKVLSFMPGATTQRRSVSIVHTPEVTQKLLLALLDWT